MEDTLYTTREAADYLGIPVHRMYDLRATNQIPHELVDPAQYKGSRYRFKQGELDKWSDRQVKEKGIVLDTMEKVVEKVLSEEDLMHLVMKELFVFLRQFEYGLGITGMRKIAPGAMQLWAIETANIDVHVVTEGETVHVISPQNQKYLELINSELLKRLKAAETTLAFLRMHPKDYILTEYSEEILVQIEPREKGYLVTCPTFPMIAAIGPTEEEAIKVFKGLLFGYTYHLSTHQAELSPQMRELFHRLKEIRVEV